MRSLLIAGGFCTLAAVATAAAVAFRRRRRGVQGASACHLPRGSSLETLEPSTISVLTYNILADAFSSSLQAHTPAEDLAWGRRWPLIQHTLSSACADILCLQEVDVSRLEELLGSPAVAGYAAIVQEAKGRAVVLVILHRPRLRVWWSDSRSRTLLAAFLFEDSDGATQALYVVNAHLDARKPADRIAQVRNSLAALAAHQAQSGLPPEDCNVIFAGDFNSGPHESVCTLLSTGFLAGGTRERSVQLTSEDVSHPYLLRDVYHTAGLVLPFTRRVPALSCTLDFVYASCHLAVEQVLQPLDGLDRRLAAYPNKRNGSDHVPLGVVLRCWPVAGGA